MAPTRVVCDGRALGDASALRGVGTYLRQLLAQLATRSDVEVTALVRPGVPLPPGVGRLALRRLAPDRWATAEHHLLLPRDLARGGADVAHSPALDPPRRCSTPWVQTIHDVLPLAVSDPALAVERRRWRRFAPRVRTAAAVITPSAHSAGQAVELLGVDPSRVHVVPHGVDPRFRPGCGDRDRYLLMVAEYGPHKGFAEAAEVARLLAAAGVDHELRITGRVAAPNRHAVEAAVAGSPVRLLGWVPDLLPHYQRASVLIVPSRHEGFGLPALEAMATATPVVAFANTATSEVVADGGILVPDGDTAAMAGAVGHLLADPAAWKQASEAAARRATRFDWAKSAEAHAEIFRSVA
ncbi:MAG TPA: glycosyltransferase family 1 protein [Acidimicrobiales bacterium]|nr:glycosyltransferase family 1 protein [Acidimicrobiales bacterium]